MSFGKRFFGRYVRAFAVVLIAVVSGLTAFGQSPLQDVPTPITSNEITGSIKPRDIGDPRVTTYYYWFEGSQGDVFVNVVTKNFVGDIDVFIQSGLRPLTKIVVYPDFGEIETGRVIYLRKPEKLLLRVQGKTPNDEPAEFRMKFAGSFVAATGTSDVELPKVTSDVTGNVRVNSVGTILERPKPAKTVREVPVKETETEEQKTAPVAVSETAKEEDTSETKKTAEPKKLEVVVTDDLPKESKESVASAPVKTTGKTRQRRTRPVPKETAKVAETSPDASVEEKAVEKKTSKKTPLKAEKVVVPDPLANVQLVILFKDGRKIERPLTEVFRFSVDRGVLTVVAKDGRIGRYSMVDVAKVTIE